MGALIIDLRSMAKLEHEYFKLSPMHKTRGSKSFWLIVPKYKLEIHFVTYRMCRIVDASMQPLSKNIFFKVFKKIKICWCMSIYYMIALRYRFFCGMCK
jgi:hypothetical protein